MRDHGGNLDWAMDRWGGSEESWADLSTGINPRPYPVPDLPQRAWSALPTRSDLDGLLGAAQAAYDTKAGVLAVAGAQAAIQMIPLSVEPGVARVLGPTYNEHAAAFAAAGWRVETVTTTEALAGADMAVVVNPNNPDGRVFSKDELLGIAGSVDCLVVDESFADARPEVSVAPDAGAGLIVLRSFGKFYGLAGLRLGFALGDVARLQDLAGPWPVSGASIAIGRQALADKAWWAETTARLQRDAARLDALAQGAGWKVVGGTSLFRLYDTDDAEAAQQRLAKGRVWSRIFPYSDRWLRLGLPDGRGWAMVEEALRRR